ncbi:hypothetical protein HDV00_007916 [Rhizophlyctis rosea]|nr:hypothetical protein HDV00_007916 [Rhizophlyctis rosea]
MPRSAHHPGPPLNSPQLSPSTSPQYRHGSLSSPSGGGHPNVHLHPQPFLVRVLHDYKGSGDNGLVIRAGDVIEVTRGNESGWWFGGNEVGEVGWFPSNYVLRIQSPSPTVSAPHTTHHPTTSPLSPTSPPNTLAPLLPSETYHTPVQSPYRDNTISSSSSSYRGAGSGYVYPQVLNLPDMDDMDDDDSVVGEREVEVELPENWGRKYSPEGRPYYFNVETDETTWFLEDIDLETGELRQAKPPVPRPSIPLPPVPTPPLSPSGSTGTSQSSFFSAQHPWTYTRLMSLLTTHLATLTTLSAERKKDQYVSQTSSIVECVRVLLHATGMMEKREEEGEGGIEWAALKAHQRGIMSTLSRLVLAAKIASGVWPPPDAHDNMRNAGSEVLFAVRHFVAAAQEAGVEVKDPTGSIAVTSAILGDSATPSAAVASVSQAEGTSNAGDASSTAESSSTPPPANPQTNAALINLLTTYTQRVSNLTSTFRSYLLSTPNPDTQRLITTVREIVVEVGEYLSTVDDVPFDVEDDVAQEFKVNRVALYDSIKALVGATTGVTTVFGGGEGQPPQQPPQQPNSPVAQKAKETLITATLVVEKAVKDQLLAAKFLVEEKDAVEHQTLLNYIEQYGHTQQSAVSTGGGASVGGSIYVYPPQNREGQGVAGYGYGGRYGGYGQQPPQPAPIRRISGSSRTNPPSVGRQNSLLSNSSGGGERASMLSDGEGAGISPRVSEISRRESNGSSGVSMSPTRRRASDMAGSGGGGTGGRRGSGGSGGVAPASPGGRRPMSELSIVTAGEGEEGGPARPGARGRPTGSKIAQLLGPEAPKGAMWYLGADYNADELVINDAGKVKGGTLNALIVRLTMHNGLDMNFVSTFLLTYRSFTTSTELFHLLINRFNIHSPDGLKEEEYAEWVEKKQTPVKLRVLNIMKSWLETHGNPDSMEDIHTERLIHEFAIHTHRAVSASNSSAPPASNASPLATPLAQIIRLIDMREAGASTSLRKVVPTVRHRDAPPPVVPKNLRSLKLLDLDPIELARQITLMESAVYCKIQPVETLKKAWSEKDSDVSVNIKAMIAMTNQVSGWIVQTILTEREVKKRALYVKLFVQIAERCRVLNNFNTIMSILAGLNSSPVHRLNRTWELVSPKTKASLDQLRNMMASTKNFAQYRDLLRTLQPPCIPFLGCYLTDLTFIEDGNPDFLIEDKDRDPTTDLPLMPPVDVPPPSYDAATANRKINFWKRAMTADVIREIQQYQNEPYILQPVPEIQNFLKGVMVSKFDDAALYELSHRLEPKET